MASDKIDFKLRAWQMSDLDSLVRYADNWNIAKHLRDRFPHPYREADGRLFIQGQQGKDPVEVFAIEVNGEAVGGIGLHPLEDIHRKNAEMGYWLAEPLWGRGIISRAIRKVVDHGFTHFDLNRIFAAPFGSNIGSQKVLEKNGFIHEGRFEQTLIKKDEYHDELIYAVRRENWHPADTT